MCVCVCVRSVFLFYFSLSLSRSRSLDLSGRPSPRRPFSDQLKCRGSCACMGQTSRPWRTIPRRHTLPHGHEVATRSERSDSLSFDL